MNRQHLEKCNLCKKALAVHGTDICDECGMKMQGMHRNICEVCEAVYYSEDKESSVCNICCEEVIDTMFPNEGDFEDFCEKE